MDNDLKKLKLTDQQRDFLLFKINDLRRLSKQKITEDFEKHLINNFQELVCFFPNLGLPVTFGDCFERIVINKDVREEGKNKRLSNYSQIKYPPKSKEKFLNYNRASMKEQSIFYGGYGMLATTLETTPKLGNLITTSKWKQKENMSLIYFPIFYKQHVALTSEFKNDWKNFLDFVESLDKNLSKVLLELLAFITEVFTKPVSKENKKEYLFSALFSNYYLTNKNSNIQCLYYPSVPCDFVSANIACLPETLDLYFDCVEVIEDIIIKEPDNYSKGWLSVRTAKAIDVSTKAIGEILWTNTKSEDELLELKKVYQFD